MSRANPRFHRINAPLPTLTTTAVRATFFYLVDQQTCLWTMDFTGTALTYSSAAFEAAMASALNTSLTTTIRACLAADCSFTAVKIQSLDQPSRMPGYFNVASANQAGTVAGNHLTSELAAIVTKQTSLKGQHGRGRFYLPGLSTTFLTPATDANRLNAAGNTAVTNLMAAIVAFTYADGANTYAGALTSRVLHGAPTTQGIRLTSLTNRILLGVIRRRRIGRGK